MFASLGLHPNIKNNTENINNFEEPEIDVIFYGASNERRAKIFENISNSLHNEANIMWIYGMTGQTLDKYIGNAKIILNLHTYEPWNRQEQTRMFYPIINGKTVVSEKSQENNMDGCVIEAETNDLPNVLRIILKNDIWRYYGKFAKENFMKISETHLRGM